MCNVRKKTVNAVPRKSAGPMSITYVTGTQAEHSQLVYDFLLDHFRVSEPITSSLGATKEDLVEFFADLRDGGLVRNAYSTLAFEGDELVAISLNNVKELVSDHTELQILDPHRDYAKSIENGPYNQHVANQIVVFVETLEEELPQLLASPCKIFKIEVICVRNIYQGRGIARTLVERAFETAKTAGCQWAVASCTAVASQTLFQKMGFRTIRELPFSCYRENGTPVFQNLPDGGRSGKLMVYEIQVEEDEDLK